MRKHSDEEKMSYYTSRMHNSKLTDGQREYARKFVFGELDTPKEKPKSYSIDDKVLYYKARAKDKSLTENQRKHAQDFVTHANRHISAYDEQVLHYTKRQDDENLSSGQRIYARSFLRGVTSAFEVFSHKKEYTDKEIYENELSTLISRLEREIKQNKYSPKLDAYEKGRVLELKRLLEQSKNR